MRSTGGPLEPLPDAFYKLHRINFLLILCKELARINGRIRAYAEKRFETIDTACSGLIDVKPVRAFMGEVAQAVNAPHSAQDAGALFLQLADAAMNEKLPEQVNAATVASVHQSGFVQASAALVCKPSSA